jgi:phenylalanyl-tRNA synthetase beta chain
MRPINLLVDATNYVLLEYGQPVHAYDMRYLAGNAINVRAARVSDSLTTLDGQELKLRAGDILICDGEKPVGLAGIMGGQNSEIKDDTTAVVIEVAQFNPLQVRKTGKRLGLHTEASHRFERGVDIENTVHAAFRVAEVMALGAAEAGLGSVEIASAAVDVYPRPRMKASIALRIKRLKKILGLATISVDNCVNHLTSLGFVLVDKTDQRMLFEVPSWRHDVTREIDLIEEVARLHGFDKIPYELPSMNIGPTPESPVIAFIDDLRHGMAGLGLSEIITFPFTSHAVAAKLGITGPHPLLPSLRLKNSLNEEMDFMQTTLLSGLLEALLNNRKQGRKGTRLFEIGRGYFDLKNRPVDTKTYPFFANWVRPSYHYSEKAISEANRPRERQLLGGILDFPFQDKSWWQDEAPVSFFHGKDIIVAICKNFGIAPDKLNFARPKAEELPFLHPGAAATIHCEGHTLGWLGELHPGVAMGVDLDPETVPCCFELDIDAVLAATKERQRTVTFASKFPAVTRDIALLVDRKVTHHDFELCFKDFPERAHLRRYDLFDVYAGDKVPQGQHSYAYTLSFQSLEKTLTDKDVDSELTRLLDWTKKKLDATQR